MKTNSPTHENIAQRAQEIWNSRGSPSGRDNEIWLEAERQLTGSEADPAHDSTETHSEAQPFSSGKKAAVLAKPVDVETKDDPASAIHVPSTSPDAVTAQETLQKNAARAPKLPHGKPAPKAAPPESGKPVWAKPHSS